MTESIWVALALAPIAFLGATVYGLTGFGSSLVTIPLSTHFLPLPFALAVFSVVDLLNALRIGLADRRFAVTPELVRMVPLMLLGILAGVTVLVNLPRQMGMLALGVFVLAYSVYALTYRGGLRTLREMLVLRQPAEHVIGRAVHLRPRAQLRSECSVQIGSEIIVARWNRRAQARTPHHEQGHTPIVHCPQHIRTECRQCIQHIMLMLSGGIHQLIIPRSIPRSSLMATPSRDVRGFAEHAGGVAQAVGPSHIRG